MPTNPRIVAPTSVDNGQSATVSVAFDLDPGSPDRQATLVLTDDGGEIIDEPVTLKGRPAEAFPQIVLTGPAPAGGYKLTLEGGEAADRIESTATPGTFLLVNG